MTKENRSSKQEAESKETKDLKKKVNNLQKMLDMTLEHETKSLKSPKGHSYPDKFGKYEMM